ncbi:nucleoside monophosphate kinase [Micromonospora sp. NPDC047074]|uniref:adenylate kinase family protein n=1 Tax=Micromonospora sp. NPDC047074 TaxID=3154339 RepID=UPI0033D9A420
MRLLVVGPPGSDREAIADAIALRLDVPRISMSDVFQSEVRAVTPAAVQAQHYMNSGDLVPVQVILSMIRNRLGQPDTATGFVLGNTPNQVLTAEALDATLSDLGTPVDRVIELVLPDAEVLRRLTGRRTCRVCGRIWHVEFAAPARPGTCDRCGGDLFQRYDDSPERVTAGLESYRPAVAPVLHHYRSLGKLVSVDATLAPSEIVRQATS